MAADEKLSFCLDSLIAQTISDYEIIAVDDCSTDNSMEIMSSYADKYPGLVRAIHSNVNLHQGGAKNIGIRAAKGEFIGFVDADDFIAPNMYEKLLAKADETGADVVGCDYSLVYEHSFKIGDEIVANSTDLQTGVLDHVRKANIILDCGSLCVKIFKRQIILDNNLFFPENIFYEDNAMGCSYMLTAKRFEYIKEPLYYYYQHGNSTVHSFSQKRCEDRMDAGRILLKEARRLGFYDEFKDELEYDFTLLFYINTLFTYMPMVRPVKYSFVKAMSREMKETFPSFSENRYYIKRTGAEEKKLIDMAMKSTLMFIIYYKLLWAYRNLRKKLKKH